MKVYAQDFSVYPMSPWPNNPLAFESMKQAAIAYEQFCEECDRYGQQPIDAWLFIGSPEPLAPGEAWYSYPDYPDYVMTAKRLHGGWYRVKIDRAY